MGKVHALRSIALSAALAVAAVLGGCRTTDVLAEPPVRRNDLVSLDALAGELGLSRGVGEHGRVVYADADGDTLKVFPGSNALTVHGRSFDASEALRLSGDEIWLRSDDAEELRRIWVEEEGETAPPPPPERVRPTGPLPPPPKKREPRPARRPRLGAVVLDAGHGGKDPGATSSAGVREKDVVLDVALRASRLLTDKGVTVTLTRSHDTFVELEERAAVGNRVRALLFVSLHADAAESVSASGFSAYVRRQPSVSSKRAADELLRAMRSTGGRNRGVKEANYRVLRRSQGPAVLLELGFMSNPSEAAKLADPKHRQRLAECVARGVLQFLGR